MKDNFKNSTNGGFPNLGYTGYTPKTPVVSTAFDSDSDSDFGFGFGFDFDSKNLCHSVSHAWFSYVFVSVLFVIVNSFVTFNAYLGVYTGRYWPTLLVHRPDQLAGLLLTH